MKIDHDTDGLGDEITAKVHNRARKVPWQMRIVYLAPKFSLIELFSARTYTKNLITYYRPNVLTEVFNEQIIISDKI